MIKVIEGLPPYEVERRYFEDNQPVAILIAVDTDPPIRKWCQVYPIQPGWNHIDNTYAIIDLSYPNINWYNFDWNFFDPYGGIQVVGPFGKDVLTSPPLEQFEDKVFLDPDPEQWVSWFGEGDCPVPDNVEVEIRRRDDEMTTNAANQFIWSYGQHQDLPRRLRNIIAFRLTGKIR